MPVKRIHLGEICARAEQGFALVVVLAFVSLLTFLLVAYFSTSVSKQQILANSSAQVQVGELARGAIGLIGSELRQEIAAGSRIDEQRKVPIYIPKSNRTLGPALAYSSNPATTPPPNILKRSARGIPFFPASNGNYDSTNYPPSSLASACGTEEVSFNGRAITKQRWGQGPCLVDASKTDANADPTAFLAPDWIIVTRGGPKAFTAWDDKLKNTTTSNPAYAVGRFAYVIYDEGGLLDVNVAGNGLGSYPTSNENLRRGRLNQADLAQIPNLTADGVRSFLQWRAALTGTNTSSTPHSGSLFDPARDFITVQRSAGKSDQTFLSRQDLITYAIQHPDQFGTDAAHPKCPPSLQYLGTFSREKNAPTFSPVLLSATTSATNPDLTSVRFQSTRTLTDGTTKVTEGAPLMRKRFPLSRLAWLTASGPSANASGSAYNPDGTEDNLSRYFGLTYNGFGSWTYKSGTIKTLADVASEIPPRDPDFFEVLKAAILNGSLGQNYSGDFVTQSGNRDKNSDLHIIQIGANLIDQYDSDNYPTNITFGTSSATGVENLPYINEICFFPYRRKTAEVSNSGYRTIYLYMVPRLWNQHQPVTTSASNMKLRMVVNGGTCALNVGTSGTSLYNFSAALNATTHQITFSNSCDFSDPNLIPPLAVISGESGAAAQLFNGEVSPSVAGAQAGAPLTATGILMLSGQAPDSRLTTSSTSSDCAAVQLSGTTTIELQYSPDGTHFYPYQHYEVGSLGYGSGCGYQGMKRGEGAVPSWAFVSSGVTYNGIFVLPSIQSLRAVDSRSPRFGLGLVPNGTPNLSAWYGATSSTSGAISINPGSCGYSRPYGSSFFPKNQSSGNDNLFHPGYYSINTTEKDTYYIDLDNIIRRADGDEAHDVHPTYSVSATTSSAGSRQSSRMEDRPVILNRPFRSVGDMGYAFRDLPWKTLNFFSSDSADAGLLDAFSVDDNEVVAGRVNLNTRQPAVLKAMLAGTLRSELSGTGGTPAMVASATTDGPTPDQIASFITNWTNSQDSDKGPLLNRSELVTKILANSGYPTASSGDKSDYIKTRREAAIRALAEAGQTRTWNLLIDIIAQWGRYPASVSNSDSAPLSRFLVEGECRYWLHLAIDRYTGEIVDQKTETVYE